MGFRKSAAEKQLKATKKELEFYRELLMDNQQVSFKQAHVLELILSNHFNEESVIPVPDLVIDEDWLHGMKEANRGALQSMTDIAQFNENQMASSATVVTSEEE
jgi:hypothetical protein